MNDEKGSARVVLRDVRDERGTRYLAAQRREDGGIVIEGHDLGRGVEVFGPGLSEYEWFWTIEPDADVWTFVTRRPVAASMTMMSLRSGLRSRRRQGIWTMTASAFCLTRTTAR